MALVFDENLKVITVEKTQTTLTIQDLYDEIRLFEEKLPYLFVAQIANGSGKQSLGGGITVGITLELINDWRLSFEERDGIEEGGGTILCTVSGGNLVATNIYSNNPIKPTAYTQVVISQSSSATVIAPPSDYHMLYLINSLRGKQRSVGSFFYWNPTSGADSRDGTSPTNAVATFAKAQTLASSGNGDTIFCIASHTSGTTTVTETLNITVANLKVMGPGHSFKLIPTATTAPTILMAAANVEVSGLYVETAGSGTQNAISVTANNAFIQDCWIANVRGNGINISATSRTNIQSNVIEHCGKSGAGDGIKLGNTTTEALISKSIIFDNVNGISLAGTGLADNIMENNLIYQNSGYGITVGSGVLRTHVRSGHTFNKNIAGSTQDLGTDTYIETQAGGASASEIADAVWDEVLSGHLTASTTGKTLSDAKKRATLASLK
ncbi:MAG: right-handed parallel beta-helix repeat-containing protein [Candidatus Levybacteria bacterium]|nr:right-handed parallel beta-helix repeat-containing protein [Candidatus Levybacteria bacterium]